MIPEYVTPIIKLEIINNPGASARWIADRVGADITMVYRAYKQLNIQRSTRPKHYVG
jgi:hypothetical protein